MKYKKLVLFILLIVLALSLIALGACSLLITPYDEQRDNHKHTFATIWKTDEYCHWHPATCKDTDEVRDMEPHIFDGNCICTVCGYYYIPPFHTHTYSDEWVSNEESHWHPTTCKHTKITSPKEPHTFDENGDCTACGYHIHVFSDQWLSNEFEHWYPATCEHDTEEIGRGNHTFDDGKCSVCGYIADGDVYQCFDEYTWSEDGQYVYFGEYPQSEVTDNAIVANLNWGVGMLPTTDNSQQWTDYGYCFRGVAQGNMWYIDLVLNGVKYRGVYITSYRRAIPPAVYNAPWQQYQDDNGYFTDTVYWFKYEPLRWRVLSQSDGTAFLMCDSIIDCQSYQDNYYVGEDRLDYTNSNNAPAGTFANNYQYSTIRRWLNDDFYNTAFGAVAQQHILTTQVDNSATTNRGSETYACDNTYDKVFLLSWQDILNSDYGFSSDSAEFDPARGLKPSSYAQSQGAYTFYVDEWNFAHGYPEEYRGCIGNGLWWLRSPVSDGEYYSDSVSGIDCSGSGFPYIYIVAANHGVVPALRIQL